MLLNKALYKYKIYEQISEKFPCSSCDTHKQYKNAQLFLLAYLGLHIITLNPIHMITDLDSK